MPHHRTAAAARSPAVLAAAEIQTPPQPSFVERAAVPFCACGDSDTAGTET